MHSKDAFYQSRVTFGNCSQSQVEVRLHTQIALLRGLAVASQLLALTRPGVSSFHRGLCQNERKLGLAVHRIPSPFGPSSPARPHRFFTPVSADEGHHNVLDTLESD